MLFADLKGSMELLADRDPEGGQAPPSPSACLPLLVPSEVGLEDLLKLAPIGLAPAPYHVRGCIGRSQSSARGPCRLHGPCQLNAKNSGVPLPQAG